MQKVYSSSANIAGGLCQTTLAYLSQALEQNEPNPKNHNVEKIEKVWLCVQKNLQHRWTIGELAKLAFMSKPHFHNVIREVYGCSPIVQIRKMRIDHAKTLLKFTDYKLEQIAIECGYQSPFSLSSAFKKVTGNSPDFFRKNK
ncbi:MAG: AraC family transcriptional regulator [Lentisphaeria bacterium]|nr:AraC family transcriptional regulator [Lentisphaeria bacterium]